MQVRRFIVPRIPAAGGEIVLPAAEALHAGKVLRLRVGERVDLLDGAGGRAEAVLSQAGTGRRFDGMACRVLSRESCLEPALSLRLYIAPPRARLMGDVVRAATELGVRRVTPILCHLSVSRPEAGALEGWRQDVLVAAKQSGNPFLPVLDAPTGFAEALREAAEPGVFGAVPRGAPGEAASPPGVEVAEERPPLNAQHPTSSEETVEMRPAPPGVYPSTFEVGCSPFDVRSSTPARMGASPLPATCLGVWIGPEGGFTAAEEQALLAKGLAPLAVGPWILRVETAVPALLGRLWGEQAHA